MKKRNKKIRCAILSTTFSIDNKNKMRIIYIYIRQHKHVYGTKQKSKTMQLYHGFNN